MSKGTAILVGSELDAEIVEEYKDPMKNFYIININIEPLTFLF
jgi:hypothetical protein